ALVAGAPAPARAAAGVDVSATEGAPFTGQVASIDCSFDSATITWGDGQSSAGTANAAGDQISGSHTYAEEGDYSGRVTYADDCGSHFVSFKAHVTDAALSASGNDISTTAGVDSSQVVAHFTDANPGAATSDFSATVSWGDGSSSSTGAVSAPAGGGFDVTAGHTYPAAGTYTVTVSIGDVGGSTAAPTATATVAPPPPGAPE